MPRRCFLDINESSDLQEPHDVRPNVVVEHLKRELKVERDGLGVRWRLLLRT